MKTASKIIFTLKLGILLFLSCLTVHLIVEQQLEMREWDTALVSDYQSAEGVNQVIPGGIMTGIYAETKGVLALGVGNITTDSGTVNSPAEGVIEKGDYILSCNGKELESKEELMELVENCQGKKMDFVILRDDEELNVSMTPVQDEDTYRIGVWVRDDIAGLGMLTFVTPQLEFGALGHCISDMDLGIEMNIREGTLHNCRLTSIKKGEAGSPGQLIGYINYRASQPIGYIQRNTSCGIAGKLEALPEALEDVTYVSIADADEVHKGEALVICDVSGSREAYTIEIEKIHSFFSTENKNFTIRVTDERLLELTGGIVQGMSGAPIIQDGKLIGAVTHVLIDNPTKGYGIFIENMLEH